MPELESPLTTAFQVAGLTRAIADGAARVPFPRATDRTAWAGIDAASRAEILHQAAQVVDEPWPVLTLSQRLAFERTGSRRAFEAPYFARRRRLTIVALAHAVAPEPRWAQDLVDGLGLLLEETSWCLPAHDAPPGGERRRLPEVGTPVLDLFAAESAAQLAWIAEVHAEELAEVPGLLRRIGAEVTFRILRPFAEHGSDHWWFGGESNWNPWIVANVLTASTLMRARGELPGAIIGQALESLDGYLAQVPADGGCAEGIMYWWRSPACLFEALDVLSWCDPDGAAQAFAHPLVASMVRYPLLTHLGGPWWASLADGAARVPEPGPGVDKERQPPALLHRFASAVGDQETTALAASFPRPLQFHQSFYRCLVTLFDPGWRAARVITAPAPPNEWLPQTALWATSSPDGRLRLVAKGGHNDEPHNHLDVGSLVLAVDGEPVLIDVGTGQYSAQSFSSGRYAAWFTQSAFHTVPEVDGVAQGVGRRFRAKVLAQAERALELDLTQAYPSEARIRHWRRALELEDRLTVTETWALGGPDRDVRVHLMLARPAEERGEGQWVLPGPSGRPRAVLLVPDDGSVSVAQESIDLDDPILRGVWGPQIARLTLTAGSTLPRGEVTWAVRPL